MNSAPAPEISPDVEREPPRGPILIARAVMLAGVGVLMLVITGNVATLAVLALLVAASLPSVLAPTHAFLGPLGRVAEVVTTCLGAGYVVAHVSADHWMAPAGAAAGAVLPSLILPPVAAALLRRRSEAFGLVGLAALVLAGLA